MTSLINSSGTITLLIMEMGGAAMDTLDTIMVIGTVIPMGTAHQIIIIIVMIIIVITMATETVLRQLLEM